MPARKIEAGTPFYSGRLAGQPEVAKRKIELPEEWAMFEGCPEATKPNSLDTLAQTFLNKPHRTGGVTGYLQM